MKNGIIILAAGKGTRMNSDIPKVCFELCGKTLIDRVIETSLSINPDLIGVVVGYKKELVIESVKKSFPQDNNIYFITQEYQNGTGDAVRCATETFQNFHGTVFVLCGDVPLLKKETLLSMLEKHVESAAKCTVLTMVLNDPDKYGRIVRSVSAISDRHRTDGVSPSTVSAISDRHSTDGVPPSMWRSEIADTFPHTPKVKEIVEYKDASETIRNIKEVNTGIYCFDSETLFRSLNKLDKNNAQGEYYLTDLIKIISETEDGAVESVVLDDVIQATGVNSQEQLKLLEQIINKTR